MSQNGVLVVTGGSRGIGAATAMLGAERGYAVVVNYANDVAAAERVCGAIHAIGGEAIAVRGDVSQPGDVEHIFAAADRLGPLSGLVNNAGIILPAMRVDEMDAARLAHGFAVNVTGAFLCAGAAIRRMSTRFGGRGGSIVNVSSAAAKLGGASTYVDYAAGKGAIDSFTIGLALEVAGEGVRVNAVRPGVIDTEIHASGGDPDRVARMAASLPMARAGTAGEVARAIMWLMSDEASYSTGSILAVSGGPGHPAVTIELGLLLWSLPLYGLYLGAQSLFYRAEYGVEYAATARDEIRPPGVRLGRAERALKNFQETWTVYIVLLLVAQLAAPGHALVLWGAVIYLVARVAYLPLYLLGIFGIRSLFWLVSLAGLTLMFFGVLF